MGISSATKRGTPLGLFDIIDSVDSERLAERIDGLASSPVPVLLEVNISGEPAKHGFDLAEVDKAAERIGRRTNLEVRGLMAMAPRVEDPGEARPFFRALREAAERLGLTELSMGMTGDFEVAVEEGADDGPHRACALRRGGAAAPRRAKDNIMKLAFIGGGVMAEAILTGVLRDGVSSPSEVTVADVIAARLDELRERHGVAVTGDNAEAVSGADLIILAVKPQNVPEVLDGLKGAVGDTQTVLSIVAGATIGTIANRLNHQSIVRAMPNTPGTARRRRPRCGRRRNPWTPRPARSPAGCSPRWASRSTSPTRSSSTSPPGSAAAAQPTSSSSSKRSSTPAFIWGCPATWPARS